jgi:hypothetical protein
MAPSCKDGVKEKTRLRFAKQNGKNSYDTAPFHEVEWSISKYWKGMKNGYTCWRCFKNEKAASLRDI